MNILFFVNHLLGVGHLKRMTLLARALSPTHKATLISGGMPVPSLFEGVDLIQIPPLKTANESFSSLLTDQDIPPDEAYFKRRQHKIREAVLRTNPDCLITEHFPFGRKKLKQDFNVFLNAGLSLEKRPLIAASVRDILVSSAKKPDFSTLPYDLVLIHGDENLRPEWNFIKGPTPYFTGYIHEEVTPEASLKNKIIVVAGGRSISKNLANSLAKIAEERDEEFIIRSVSPDKPLRNCTYTDFIPNLAAKLPHAKLLITEAGYNSFLNAVSSKVPTLFIPFHSESENEQYTRLTRMNAESWAELIMPQDLSADRLKSGIDKVLSKTRTYPELNIKGIENTIRILDDYMARS